MGIFSNLFGSILHKRRTASLQRTVEFAELGFKYDLNLASSLDSALRDSSAGAINGIVQGHLYEASDLAKGVMGTRPPPKIGAGYSLLSEQILNVAEEFEKLDGAKYNSGSDHCAAIRAMTPRIENLKSLHVEQRGALHDYMFTKMTESRQYRLR